MTTENKVALIWSLGLPLGLMVLNNKNVILHPVHRELAQFISTYWGYMMVANAINGVGLSLLIMREKGFLKMFRFISGSVSPIVIGTYLTQLVFVTISSLMVTCAAMILFRSYSPILLIACVINSLVSMVPISMFISWIPVLSVREDSLSPILNIGTIGLLYLSEIHASPNLMAQACDMLNPVVYVIDVSKVIFMMFGVQHLGHLAITLSSLIIVTCIYFVFGIFSLSRIKISSKVMRN